jgi:hypothetical protein
MDDVTPPNWQTLVEAGLLMDLTEMDSPTSRRRQLRRGHHP